MIFYNIHDFLFQTKYEGESVENWVFLVKEKSGEEVKIVAKDIEITNKRIAFSIVKKDGEKVRLPFLRVLKIFNSNNDLVFDNC